MKIAAIVASPNGMHGHTGMIVKPMIEAAQGTQAEIQVLSFDTLTVHCCRGCTKICHTTGTCFREDDDFNMILAAMLSADGIIFATPNYCFNVSAQMKALLDRCNFPLHCGSFQGKYCATVVTAGGSDNEVVEKYLYSILTQFGFRIAGSVNAVQFSLQDPDTLAEIEKEAAALGLRLVQAIHEQEVYPEQEEERERGFQVMEFLVETMKKDWPLAYEYRQKNRMP
jgi:multimeric flavodoxin WrbA